MKCLARRLVFAGKLSNQSKAEQRRYDQRHDLPSWPDSTRIFSKSNTTGLLGFADFRGYQGLALAMSKEEWTGAAGIHVGPGFRGINRISEKGGVMVNRSGRGFTRL